MTVRSAGTSAGNILGRSAVGGRVSTTIDSATLAEPTTPGLRRHVGLALLALAMGGFAIGTTEFVSMGLLPAARRRGRRLDPDGRPRDLGVRPRRRGRRPADRGLRGAAAAARAAGRADGWSSRLGNAASALATSYDLLTLARFFAGLPHGAYFGVASLVAAEPGRRRAPGPRGQPGDARARRRQRRRRARRHLARPARSAGARRTGWWPRSPLLTVALVLWLVPHVPRQPRGHRPPRAARLQEPAGAGSPCSPGRSASAACSRCTPTSPRR